MTAEVLDKFSTLITTALGLVGKFFYAILVTIVVIFATIYVGRAAEKAKKPKKNAAASSSRAVSPQLSADSRWRGDATGA